MSITFQTSSTRFWDDELIKTKSMFQNTDFELAKTTVGSVLVVSSNSAMRKQLNRVTTKMNLVVRCMSWCDLVPICLEDRVSVVLLDTHGCSQELALCRRIRRKNIHMPILVLAKPTNDEERISSFYSQTPFYLAKPCPDDRISHMLSHAISVGLLSRKPVQPDFLHMTWEEVEHHIIINALGQSNGHRAKAAKHLDISEKTIYNKIKEFGIG